METFNFNEIDNIIDLTNYSIDNISNNNYDKCLLKCFIFYFEFHTVEINTVEIRKNLFGISFFDGEFNKNSYLLIKNLAIINNVFYVFNNKQEKNMIERKIKLKMITNNVY